MKNQTLIAALIIALTAVSAALGYVAVGNATASDARLDQPVRVATEADADLGATADGTGDAITDVEPADAATAAPATEASDAETTADSAEDAVADEATDETPDEIAEEAGEEAGDETTDATTDATTKEAGEEPADETTDETTDEAGEEPADETTDEAGEEPADETTDEAGEAPADETADETTDGTRRCDRDEIYVELFDRCISPTLPLRCGPGFVPNATGTSCVPEECPLGMVRTIDGDCVFGVFDPCPDGEELVDGMCLPVCPNGSIRIGLICTAPAPIDPVSPLENCPAGFVWIGHDCRPLDVEIRPDFDLTDTLSPDVLDQVGRIGGVGQ